MRLAPSTGLFAALLFLVVGMMIGATLTRTVDRWPLTEVGEEDWFFVDVLDCKLPIPSRYTLTSRNPSKINLYYDYDRADDVMMLQTHYPMNIRITPIEGEYKRSYSDHLDLEYETLKQNDALTYELMSVAGKPGVHLYIIRNKTQKVTLAGGSREIADLMFDHCVAHPIEESSPNCESRDGYVYCD
jgi:hypothetical protein